jgi:ADP-ribose pyrophosphatase YjhB (NUDIX family)
MGGKRGRLEAMVKGPEGRYAVGGGQCEWNLTLESCPRRCYAETVQISGCYKSVVTAVVQLLRFPTKSVHRGPREFLWPRAWVE